MDINSNMLYTNYSAMTHENSFSHARISGMRFPRHRRAAVSPLDGGTWILEFQNLPLDESYVTAIARPPWARSMVRGKH